MSRKKSVTILTGGSKKLFDNALDFYDRKQYNKALQNTKRIKKSNPGNGEALALEGLIQHSLGEKNQGYDLVKKGLGITLRYSKIQKESCLPFCFRAYALMYQTDLNFEKCAASFVNALRFDPQNKAVLRDLAHAQTLLGDWSGLVNSLRKLVKTDLTETKNWLALALAYFQGGSYQRCVSVIDNWIKQTEGELKETRERHLKNDLFFKMKRVAIFRINVLYKWKKYELVKTEIAKLQKRTKDPDLEILLGKAHLELGEKEIAKNLIYKHLVLSPENHELLRLYQKIVYRLDEEDLLKEGVYTNPEDCQRLLEHYDSLAKDIPRGVTLKRVPLTLSQGEDFERRFFEFAKPMLTRTVPSLFESVKSIYRDPLKIPLIERIMLEVTKSLEEKSQYPTHFSFLKKEEVEGEGEGEEENNNNNNNNDREAPSTVLFCYLYLAKHFDKIGNPKKGLEYIEKGITHTPTLCELYMTKSRILKHLKEYHDASVCMEKSRNMDLADRFLNTKSVKYLLLDQKVEEAYRISYLFSNNHEGKFNLHEQQGVKFEMQLGASYRRMGRLCLALREFERVRKYFLHTRKNMNSFHDYFLKKCSVSEYLDMVKYVRNIKSEKLYLDATAEAAEMFLMFHNNPGLAEFRNKISPDQAKKWQIAMKDRDAMDFIFGEFVGNKKDGYFQKALEYVHELESLRNNHHKTQVLAMLVYERMKKPLLLLRAIKLALQINPKEKKFCKDMFESLKGLPVDEKMNEIAKNVLDEEIKVLEEFFKEG